MCARSMASADNPEQARDLGGTLGPRCVESSVEVVKPTCARLRVDKKDPMLTRSNTKATEPSRKDDCSGAKVPRCTESRTSAAGSGLAGDRTSTTKPGAVKSRVDSGKPMATLPKVAVTDPGRVGDLGKRRGPRRKKSMTGMTNAARARPRRSRLRPDITRSGARGVEPKRAPPNTREAEPT